MTTASDLDALQDAQGMIEFLESPSWAVLSVDGEDAPGGPAFQDALQALYAVSYPAHFVAKKE